jgi:hypothetical protein
MSIQVSGGKHDIEADDRREFTLIFRRTAFATAQDISYRFF